VPLVVCVLTAGYWKIGRDDLATNHAIRRNFPVLCHVRYLFESIRPEIQQYFIESDDDAHPFSRAMRSTIYQRSKAQNDTRALGTRRNVYAEGYEWGAHSMFPVDPHEVETRVQIGTSDKSSCMQPYSASLYNISAMSYGALSANAISALNLGAKAGGFYHNTGEGGLSQFHLLGSDVVWNIGTGYFACGNSNGPNGARQFDEAVFQENAMKPNVKMIGKCDEDDFFRK
jgi:glutamate synthase domain-containing protein 2